ncbi:hydrolethalus syndrome protein 1 homolog isoform X1 [Myripristis murdjan]|uniref:hydrolethalus syndrome protein 1 homolog isoform X1 n=1 Tax=Myripristis murdjan TaxID=586833 RepID=UPI001176106C|nr:hydrolethalus syndrome protein 1 isoform X1 [Myripristis murdjan]
MYKMYNTQWDEESEGDKNSLGSSFWSDRSERDEEEEEEEIERVVYQEDSKPAVGTDNDYQAPSEVDQPGLDKQGNTSREASEGNEEEKGDGESCSSTDSPALSMLTSGYGTYRPEEQEGVDCRDDHTITEFDQESQEGLSEVRDDEEDDLSLSNYGGDFMEPTCTPDCKETRPRTALEDSKYQTNLSWCFEDDPFLSEMDDRRIAGMKSENDDHHTDEAEQAKSPTHERKFDKLYQDLYAEWHNKAVTRARSEEEDDNFLTGNEHLEDRSEDEEDEEQASEEQQRLEEEDKVEKGVAHQAEMEDPEEQSSNKDIKFIDSKVDFSRWTYTDKMYETFEGNRRPKKDAASGLEERLAELHVSATTQHDSETESEDVTSPSDSPSDGQSSDSDGLSLTAFESYIRGMARMKSDFRPRSKSFIRPVVKQRLKKSDPVDRYFQYKQLWKMFKLPGETDMKAIRKEIQEQLAYQPPPPKPRRVYVPNTYVVPTEKKRSALRWEIRNDLANGLLPGRPAYRF